MDKATVEKIYDCLVDCCGAAESMRPAFVYEYSEKASPSSEWRVSGKLGFGGKFRLNNNGMYVDYYAEHTTAKRHQIVIDTNRILSGLMEK